MISCDCSGKCNKGINGKSEGQITRKKSTGLSDFQKSGEFFVGLSDFCAIFSGLFGLFLQTIKRYYLMKNKPFCTSRELSRKPSINTVGRSATAPVVVSF
jgi:hypothetical protein